MSILRIQVGRLSHENIRSMVQILESFKERHRNEDVFSGEWKENSYPYLQTMLSQVGEGLKEEDALRQQGLDHSRTLTVHYDPDRLEAIPLPVREKLVELWKGELSESEADDLETFSAHFWELLQKPQEQQML